jgi:hypothetical protein
LKFLRFNPQTFKPYTGRRDIPGLPLSVSPYPDASEPADCEAEASAEYTALCKVNMYEQKTRNTKNETTGEWKKTPCYKIREDYVSFGHRIESMVRLNRFIKMSNPGTMRSVGTWVLW